MSNVTFLPGKELRPDLLLALRVKSMLPHMPPACIEFLAPAVNDLLRNIGESGEAITAEDLSEITHQSEKVYAILYRSSVARSA